MSHNRRPPIVPAEEQCATGDVRLVNGSNFAGRLEVCFYGVWGTVCRFENWNAVSADIVCRQLGINATGLWICCDFTLWFL